MTNDEKAELNYLLTKLRCQIEDFMLQDGVTPKIEKDYEEIIYMINYLLRFSIKGD